MIRFLSAIIVATIFVVTPIHHQTASTAKIALMPGPLYSGHYWFGVQYSGSNGTATSISVPVSVPEDRPQNNFYYVLTSVWDSAGSYDQIGFANNHGSWVVAYSTSPYCAGTNHNTWNTVYNYTPFLSIGSTYIFNMSLAAGYVDFVVGNWSATIYTGASTFYTNNTYTCDSKLWYGFTEYEEIYNSPSSAPPYQFVFGQTLVNNQTDMSWTRMSDNSPSWLTVVITSKTVSIDNEPFAITSLPSYFTTASKSRFAIPSNNVSGEFWFNISEISSDSVCVGTYSTNVNATFTPSCGTPNYTTRIDYSIPISQLSSSLYIGISVYDNNGNSTRAIVFYIPNNMDCSGEVLGVNVC